MIPFKKINLGWSHKQLKPYIESGYIGLGSAVFDFEKKLAEYVRAKHVIAVNSCTSALLLSLLWEKEKEGVREVSIPSMTVPLVANAVLQAGLKLSFNDNTEWVGGRYIIRGANVSDSAHQVRRGDYDYLDRKTKLCFSFYPTKSIGSADGGAIATNDSEFAEWARKVSIYGRNQTTERQNSWDYDIEMLGYKFNWNNLQAVIASEQLERLDDTNARRQEIVKKYNDALGYNNDSDYLYRIEVADRDKFIDYMFKNGVECGVHFKPLHLMTPFTDIPITGRGSVEKAYAKTVSLPLYDQLLDFEVERVITLVKAI